MKITILVGGTKGGSGKSTVARLIAKGVADLGHMAAIIQTDIDGVVPEDNRKYVTLNGAGEEKSVAALSKIAKFDEKDKLFVTVIDGSAGDNLSTDQAYAKIADLVIFPFKSGYEDMVRAKRNLNEMEQAFGLPNDWSAPNTPAYTKAQKDIAEQFENMDHRILEPVFSCKASEVLARDEVVNVTRVNKIARALAVQVLDLMSINAFDTEFKKEEVANA